MALASMCLVDVEAAVLDQSRLWLCCLTTRTSPTTRMMPGPHAASAAMWSSLVINHKDKSAAAAPVPRRVLEPVLSCLAVAPSVAIHDEAHGSWLRYDRDQVHAERAPSTLSWSAPGHWMRAHAFEIPIWPCRGRQHTCYSLLLRRDNFTQTFASSGAKAPRFDSQTLTSEVLFSLCATRRNLDQNNERATGTQCSSPREGLA